MNKILFQIDQHTSHTGYMLRKFYKLADYLTINISSPNTENLRSFHDKEELNDLLSSIEKEKINLKTAIPIAVKISPDINDEDIEIISDLLICLAIEKIIILKAI